MEGKTVLLVEDDANLLDVLHYNLTREGYRVATARDGQEALDVARQVKPDLLLLDIMLPKLDGLEVCRILRKEMTVPILMLTAKADEIDRVVGLEVGADDYVTKPFSLRELLARVRAVLRRADLGREPAEPAVDGGNGCVVFGDLSVRPQDTNQLKKWGFVDYTIQALTR